MSVSSKYTTVGFINVAIIAIIYFITDVYIFDYSKNSDYQTATFLKLGLIGAYAFAFSSYNSEFDGKINNAKLGLEFSVVAFCIWFPLTDLFLQNGIPSNLSGIVLLFGAIWTFIFLSTLPFEIEKKTRSRFLMLLTMVLSKIILLFQISFALFIFYHGEWILKIY